MTKQLESTDEPSEMRRTWLLVACMAASLVLWGFLLLSAVGDKGPTPWDFDAVEDVPGSSPYAVSGPKASPTLGPSTPLGSRPLVPQHVGGKGRP